MRSVEQEVLHLASWNVVSAAVARPYAGALSFPDMARDFDENEFPLAYLISFRCYGTWVHGDNRGSVDRKQNVYGTSKIPPNRSLQKSDAKQLKHPPQSLNAQKRKIVEKALREVCDHRQYILRAINVRTNHVHTVVTA